MNRKCLMSFVSVMCLLANLLISNASIAQGSAIVSVSEDAAKVLAKRMTRRLDENGNGRFERTENEEKWKRHKRVDTNRDHAISRQALQASSFPYLESSGPHKLDLRYKTVSGKDLHLELYYPDTKSDATFPVVVYTHGGGWAAGSKHGAAHGSPPLLMIQGDKDTTIPAKHAYRMIQQADVVKAPVEIMII